MAGQTAIVSYIGPDRPALISQVTDLLEEKGGSFGDVTFATLGTGAEFTFLYDMPGKDTPSLASLQEELSVLPAVQGGRLTVEEFRLKSDKGQTSRITHRFALSGSDRHGLLRDFVNAFNANNALIVRMNAERLRSGTGGRYMVRFAISMRPERAAGCVTDVSKLASSYGLKLRYETA